MRPPGRRSGGGCRGGELAIARGAPPLIARYQREHGVLQKDLARKIRVDESRVSDIFRGKIASFILDCLISYAEKFHSGLIP